MTALLPDEPEGKTQTVFPHPKAGVLHTSPAQTAVLTPPVRRLPRRLWSSPDSASYHNRQQTPLSLSEERGTENRIYFTCLPFSAPRQSLVQHVELQPRTSATADFQCTEELSTSQHDKERSQISPQGRGIRERRA